MMVANIVYEKWKMSEKKIPALAVMFSTLLLTIILFGVSYQRNDSAVDNVNTSLDSSMVSNEADVFFNDIYVHESASASNQVGDNIVISSSNLVINEFMADNDITVEGPDGTYPDWIELFNSGDELIDLSGMYMTDDLTDFTAWQFPEGTFIEPASYLLVWADNDFGQGSLHANFKLKANGGVISLFASDGKTLIDSIMYDKQLRDVSYGRIPDGSSNWEYLIISTPGSTNQQNPVASESSNWSIMILIILVIVASVSVIIVGKISSKRIL
jgi:hypothetical protein